MSVIEEISWKEKNEEKVHASFVDVTCLQFYEHVCSTQTKRELYFQPEIDYNNYMATFLLDLAGVYPI